MSFTLRDAKLLAPTSQRMEWEETRCPLCSGSRWSPLVEAPCRETTISNLRFLVVQCSDCGLCFTNPRPTQESLERFYTSSYPPHQSTTQHRWLWSPTRWLRTRRDRRMIPRFGQSRLLDFGCGAGDFLARMRQDGWQTTGVDLSPRVVEDLRTRLGMRAYTGSLPHPALQPESFEVITMWQSLEHVPRPMEVLKAAYRLLVPGGSLYVSVPNIDSLPYRWFGPAWFALDLPRHLTHFAPWTLKLMLHRVGFKAGPVQSIRHTSWLRRSARIASDNPETPSTWSHMFQHPLPARVVTWFNQLTRQTDCMMVHAVKS